MQRAIQVCPLSERQAAAVLPQLARLDERNSRRASAVQCLAASIQDVPVLRLWHNRADARPAHYKLGLQYDPARFGLPRTRLVEALRAEGIAIDEGFHAAHVGRSPRRYRGGGDLTEADRAHAGM